jgi:hypothetical protein
MVCGTLFSGGLKDLASIGAFGSEQMQALLTVHDKQLLIVDYYRC